MAGWHELRCDVNLTKQRQTPRTPPHIFLFQLLPCSSKTYDLLFLLLIQTLPSPYLHSGTRPFPGRHLRPPANCPSSPTGTGTLTTAASISPNKNQRHFLQAPHTSRWTKPLWQKSQQSLHLCRRGKQVPAPRLKQRQCETSLLSGCDHPLWLAKTWVLSRKLSVRPWDPTPSLQVFHLRKQRYNYHSKHSQLHKETQKQFPLNAQGTSCLLFNILKKPKI